MPHSAIRDSAAFHCVATGQMGPSQLRLTDQQPLRKIWNTIQFISQPPGRAAAPAASGWPSLSGLSGSESSAAGLLGRPIRSHRT